MQAREIAQALGRRGGKARAKRLSAAERQRIASLGGQARARSFEIARRIADNFRYVAVVRELQPGRQAVTRLKAFDGPVPGLYRSRS